MTPEDTLELLIVAHFESCSDASLVGYVANRRESFGWLLWFCECGHLIEVARRKSTS